MILLGFGLLVGPLVPSAIGQADSPPSEEGRLRPVLGQHRFIPNPFT